MRIHRFPILPGMVAAAALTVMTAACGGGEPAAPAASAPAAAPAASSATAAPAATPGVVTIVEPAEGSSSGHISLFRWNAVEGATGYKVRLLASTDGRTVWDSPVVSEPETHLPNTVALEPEAYIWTVTALKGEATIASSAASRFTVTP